MSTQCEMSKTLMSVVNGCCVNDLHSDVNFCMDFMSMHAMALDATLAKDLQLCVFVDMAV